MLASFASRVEELSRDNCLVGPADKAVIKSSEGHKESVTESFLEEMSSHLSAQN